MSIIPVPVREISIRVVRVFAIVLTFAFVGTLIQFAIVAVLSRFFAVYSSFMEDVWLALISTAVWAGLTGLIAGVYDAVFGRVNARAMLVISLVVTLVSLGLFVWISAPLLMPLLMLLFESGPKAFESGAKAAAESGAKAAARLLVVVSAIDSCIFVVSMMACWKLIDLVRGRTPAAAGLAPT
jgi:hypothetical protein